MWQWIMGLMSYSSGIRFFHFLPLVMFLLSIATFGPFLSLVVKFWSLSPSGSQPQRFTDVASEATLSRAG